jgi:hypothetical protein
MIEDGLDVFFDEFFSEPSEVKSETVQVIFDNDYAPMMGDFTEGRSIVACLRTSEVERLGLQHLDTIQVRGKRYRIDGIHPIQEGRLTDLVLSDEAE